MSDELMVDPFDLDAQEAARTKQDDATRLKRQIEVDDLKWLMAHKQGRRIVWRLLQGYGVFRSSFRVEALEMAFLEGARNHGLKLLADVHEHCDDRYADMMKEAKADATRSRRNDARNRTDAGSS